MIELDNRKTQIGRKKKKVEKKGEKNRKMG